MIQLPKLLVLQNNIRHVIRARRRELSSEQQMYFAQEAANIMMNYRPVMIAYRMGLFLSFDGELNTQPLIKQLWRAKKIIYLPALHPFSPNTLLFLHYHSKSPLIRNYLKIYEPQLDIRNVIPLRKLDVLVLPLVAFDKQGHRLGMGGGYYDRTLKYWKEYGLQLIGYAHDCQVVEKLAVKKWDIPLSAVVTPSRLWLW